MLQRFRNKRGTIETSRRAYSDHFWKPILRNLLLDRVSLGNVVGCWLLSCVSFSSTVAVLAFFDSPDVSMRTNP